MGGCRRGGRRSRARRCGGRRSRARRCGWPDAAGHGAADPAGRPHHGASCPLSRDLSDSCRVVAPLWPGCSRVHARAAPVERVGVPQAGEQRVVQPLPHAGGLPIAQPPPAGRAAPAAPLAGQHLPRNARTQDEDDAPPARRGRARAAPPWGLGGCGGIKGAIPLFALHAYLAIHCNSTQSEEETDVRRATGYA